MKKLAMRPSGNDRVFVFFFQAEDGIRDYKVTGVQTCALPIFLVPERVGTGVGCCHGALRRRSVDGGRRGHSARLPSDVYKKYSKSRSVRRRGRKIGRASCRERV